jgi:hypothetical protein
LDVYTELPVLAALLPSRSQWACRWLGRQLRQLKKVPQRQARLRDEAPLLGITPWVSRVEAKLPELINSVGSVRLPWTTNAIERFFRSFQRFYRTRGGFHSVLNAKRKQQLSPVVYVFTQRASTGQAPIEVIVPEARRMPLYCFINDPFNAFQERRHVKTTPTVADLRLGKAAVA